MNSTSFWSIFTHRHPRVNMAMLSKKSGICILISMIVNLVFIKSGKGLNSSLKNQTENWSKMLQSASQETKISNLFNPLAMAAIKIVPMGTITFQLCHNLKSRGRTSRRLIVTIDNYLKFLHPIQQQENLIWEEFYVFYSKTTNASSHHPGKLFCLFYCIEKIFQKQKLYNHNNV